jgi:hypothetical protein
MFASREHALDANAVASRDLGPTALLNLISPPQRSGLANAARGVQ